MTHWSIKSIKHWPDGTWDALLLKEHAGTRSYQRFISSDGFHWRSKYNVTAPDDVQDMLTTAMGSMLDQNITYFVL